MRVILWSEFYLPSLGGVEVWSRDLMRALQARGMEFIVIASHDGVRRPDVMIYEGLTVHRFRFLQSIQHNDLRGMREIVERIRQIHADFQPDLIHLNCIPCSFYFLRSHIGNQTPAILTAHYGRIQEKGTIKLVREMLAQTLVVTTVSEHVRQDFLKFVPEAEPKMRVIHNAKPDLPAGYTPASLPFDPPVFLAIGRHVKDKGMDVAVEAFARVVKDHPAARLRLVGEGIETKTLEEQAASLNLGDAVQFVGPVMPENVLAEFDRATAVLVPSRWEEPFGLVALEAMQTGRPVIASRVGGLKEIVQDGETGLLVQKEDAAALAEAMSAIITDPHRAREMGDAGRRRAIKNFNHTRMVDEFEALYRNAIGGESP